MPAIAVDSHPGILASSVAEWRKGWFTEIASRLNNYPFYSQIMRKKKRKVAYGPSYEIRGVYDHNDSARFTRIGDTDVLPPDDHVVKGSVVLRTVEASMKIERREILAAGSPGAVLDLQKTKYFEMMLSWLEKNERSGWQAPINDDKTPFSIPYHIVKSSATGANDADHSDGVGGAFLGGHASGFSSWQNIDVTQAKYGDRMKNWAYVYTDVTPTTLLENMRRAAIRIMWESPLDYLVSANSPAPESGHYMGLFPLQQLESLQRNANDSVGFDLANTDGRTLFKGAPLVYVSLLDEDSQKPVYHIPWRYFFSAVSQQGEVETDLPNNVGGSHNMSGRWLEVERNFCGEIAAKRASGVGIYIP